MFAFLRDSPWQLLAFLTIAAVWPSTLASAAEAPASLALARPGAILTADDDALLDELQRASFLFFVEQTDPVTGLVRDRR